MRLTPLLAALARLACNPGTPADTERTQSNPPDAVEGDSLLTISGTIQRVELEGGFYLIRSDDGASYDPMNLAEPFQRDGLKVRVRAKLRPDMGGIHMAGPIVEIVEITER